MGSEAKGSNLTGIEEPAKGARRQRCVEVHVKEAFLGLRVRVEG